MGTTIAHLVEQETHTLKAYKQFLSVNSLLPPSCKPFVLV